ncbi:13979_t:CDS:10 [Entrophospora sp. SA101]|nr:13979_t:CDS:10 [Entrophospora sp. SA101]
MIENKYSYRDSKYIKEGYPVPYLTNKVSFYGLSFYIKKGVFIPQKDTEILVTRTLELAAKIWGQKEQLKVLDIGTGCGNIVISLAKNKPNWNFITVDINAKARQVAKKNAVAYQLKNIELIESNLFNNVKGRFDLIVANPPYVSSNEYEDLSPAAKAQPREALIAPNDGYFFYQEIFRQAGNFLAKRFLLVVEIGYQQAEKVIKLIIEYLPQAQVSIYPDYGIGESEVKTVITAFLEVIKEDLIKGEDISFKGYFTLKRSKQLPHISKFCGNHTRQMDDFKNKNKGKDLKFFVNSSSFKKIKSEIKECNSCKTQKQKIVKATKLLPRVFNGRTLAFQANDKGTEFTIKNINTKAKAKDKDGGKDVEYKIEYENKDGNDKVKVDNKKGTHKITAKSIKKIVDGKESDVINKEIEVSYVNGMNSIRPTTWILIFVAVVLVVGVQEEEFASFLQNNHDKLVLVKFSTTWCAPCRLLHENIRELLTELEQPVGQRKEVVVLEVDAEKFPQLRNQFSVRSVPTTFLFHQNKIIKRASGNMSVQQLKEFIATFSATEVDNDSNRVKIEGSPAKTLEVTVVDENGSPIKRHTDVLKNKHKDKDTLTVKPGKKAEFEQAKTEIHKNLFEKEFSSDEIDKKKDVAGGTNMKYIILRDGRGRYKVNIYKDDENDVSEFPWERLEVVPQFYQNKQADFDNVFTIEYQEEDKKPQWTAGEREQEKKQITISCSYCNQQYQTVSTSSQDISNSSCSNCNPFYSGALASEISVGAVEKFRQREQKEGVTSLSHLGNIEAERLEGSLEIKDFPKLQEISLPWNDITSLKISNCPFLHTINFQANKLTKVELEGQFNFVKAINLMENDLTDISFLDGKSVFLNRVEELFLSDNKIATQNLDVFKFNFIFGAPVRDLRIGCSEAGARKGKRNNFFGSLASFYQAGNFSKNLKLDISGTDIDSVDLTCEVRRSGDKVKTIADELAPLKSSSKPVKSQYQSILTQISSSNTTLWEAKDLCEQAIRVKSPDGEKFPDEIAKLYWQIRAELDKKFGGFINKVQNKEIKKEEVTDQQLSDLETIITLEETYARSLHKAGSFDQQELRNIIAGFNGLRQEIEKERTRRANPQDNSAPSDSNGGNGPDPLFGNTPINLPTDNGTPPPTHSPTQDNPDKNSPGKDIPAPSKNDNNSQGPTKQQNDDKINQSKDIAETRENAEQIITELLQKSKINTSELDKSL